MIKNDETDELHNGRRLEIKRSGATVITMCARFENLAGSELNCWKSSKKKINTIEMSYDCDHTQDATLEAS